MPILGIPTHRICGAFLGGRLGGMTWADAVEARGWTAVIIASIGLSIGVLNQNLFTTIVTVVTTMSMPSMLRWALGRLPTEP
jgi:hypothetical protein